MNNSADNFIMLQDQRVSLILAVIRNLIKHSFFIKVYWLLINRLIVILHLNQIFRLLIYLFLKWGDMVDDSINMLASDLRYHNASDI